MYCTKCGVELRAEDRYCSQCGHSTGAGVAMEAPRVLMLDKGRKKIAGVCAGFARYFEVDVVLMRVLWLGLAIGTGGVGFLVYLAAWIVIPGDCGVEAREVVVARTPQTN
jgi:phage shock protein C